MQVSQIVSDLLRPIHISDLGENSEENIVMNGRRLGIFWAMVAMTELAAVALFLCVVVFFHRNPFSIYGNIVLSLGGMMFGLIGGSGAVFGALWSGVRPTSQLKIGVVCATLAALLAFHFSLYELLAANGDSIARQGGFLGFLDLIHGHASLQVSASSPHPAEIGRLGYGLLATDFFWAGLCAASGFIMLAKTPHCESCDVYFKRKAQRKLRFANQGDFAAAMVGLPQDAINRAECLMRLERRSLLMPKKGAIGLTLARSECPSCREQCMVEQITVYNGKAFMPVDRLAYTWKPTAAQRIAATMPAAPQGFGRKGLGHPGR